MNYKIQADDLPQGVSKSKVRVNFGRKAKMSVGTWEYNISYAGTMNSTAGQQGVNTPLAAATTQNMIVSSGATYSFFQSYTALQQLNPYLTNTGSVLLGTAVTPATDSFVLKNYNVNLELSNFSNVGVVMDVYCLTLKKNTNADPSALWTLGYAGNQFGTSAISLPAPGTTTGAAGFPTIVTVGARPTESKVFKEFYKIEAHRNIHLQNSSSHIMDISVDCHKIIKCDEMLKLNSQVTVYVPKLTVIIMVVQRGLLVEDTTFAAHKVTYGPTSVAYIANVKYNAHAVKNPAGRLDVNYAATQVPAGSTAVSTIGLSTDVFPVETLS
jgi:hypothetical protein